MTEVQGPIRVRFAPSPTGFLHVGGARTAIYNDLLRQHAGGAFVLRIEDTDKERSDEAMTRQIQSALAWIGTVWDEGPFLQSERLPRHHERAEELLAAGKAYRCFCTPEELDAQRDEAQKRGVAFRYPRTCLQPRAGRGRARRGRRQALRRPLPDAGREHHLHRPRARRHGLPARRARRLHPAALRRQRHLPHVRGGRRHRHGDHPRHPRRGPPVEHAQAHPALPGPGRHRADLRPPAADPRAGQEAPLQALRRHLRRGVPQRGDPPPGALQLPRPPRLEPRGRPRGPLPRRDDPPSPSTA